MNLKKVECEQFAGLLDREIIFEDGLNIVIGENESGKSTMLELIYQLLFKNVKLHKVKDKEFIKRYFPAEKVNGVQGDCIGGVLRFETSKGVYKIEKEWEKGQGNCKLITPDGTRIRALDDIDQILKEELEYGEGVYGEIIFASQKRQHNMAECILQGISNANKGTIQKELTDLVQQAAMETGGVSITELEEELKKKIAEYGSHWDFSADLPERGSKGEAKGLDSPWKKEVGQILEAYYKKEKLAKDCEKVETAEKNIESCREEIRHASEEKKGLENESNNFHRHKGALEQSITLNDKIQFQQKELSEWEEVCKEWPGIEESIEKAERLKRELGQAKTHDLFLKIEELQSEYEAKTREGDLLSAVDQRDVKTTEELQKKQMELEGQITGLNLVANIKQTGEVPIEVFSAATGSALAITDGKLSIKEAVEINIPGIMEMQLMPQGIQLEEIKQELLETKEQIANIYEKYGIKSLEELREKSKEYEKWSSAVQILKDRVDAQLELNSITWKELQKENASVALDIKTEKEIKSQIEELYGNKSIDEHIGELRGKKQDFERKHSSFDELELKIKNQKEKIEQTREKLRVVQDIPEEFQQIVDLEQYEVDLGNKMEAVEKQLESYRNQLSEAERSFGEFGNTSVEEYSEELSEAEMDFEKKKAICNRWKHIYEVFQQTKELMRENPMHDIEENFQQNLSIISSGGVSISSFDEKQMCAKLSSGNYVLNYEILSEGTKDTISLAFRLAMLKHLFPEGGSLAIFDDPFTDMDPQRVEQSCKLLQEYAENNQVIFITCDPKYQQLLSGNVISIST